MSVDKTGDTITELNPHSARYVQVNVHELVDVPEPGELWIGPEVPYNSQEIRKMHNEGIIERVYNGERVDGRYQCYRTTEDGYDAIQTFLKQREKSDRLLPCDDELCPGTSFINRGESLECKDCGQIHDKEDVR